MTVDAPATVRELDSRVSDGIHVRLLWSAQDDAVSVAVEDAKGGHSFVVPVHDGERALDVFLHPYGYAAWHRIDTGAAPAAPERDRSLAA